MGQKNKISMMILMLDHQDQYVDLDAMLDIPPNEIKTRIAFDSPWWGLTDDAEAARVWRKRVDSWLERAFLDGFVALVTLRTVNRAPVLMGPRRVGKTVLLHQTAARLIDRGVDPRRILYVSIDNPVYVGLGLERFLTYFREIHGHGTTDDLYLLFDEVQYLKDWERHLKSVVDSYPSMRFIVSGSAAAALKAKSAESGAGRFSDFLLPPLTFPEFLDFRRVPRDADHDRLNAELVDYVNFGGFPETVLAEDIRHNMSQFVANDVIDKVLLRDLPSLYGIRDQNDLKRLFSVIAYNTGQEVDLYGLSKQSGVTKNTLRSYLEFLEAAFLVHRLHRVDASAKRFRRATTFKVYLANPSLRAALFGEVLADDPKFGFMAETAFAAHAAASGDWRDYYYARWKDGEVDFVKLSSDLSSVVAAFELKWSDRSTKHLLAASPQLVPFIERNGVFFSYLLARSGSQLMEITPDDGEGEIVGPAASNSWAGNRADAPSGVNLLRTPLSLYLANRSDISPFLTEGSRCLVDQHDVLLTRRTADRSLSDRWSDPIRLSIRDVFAKQE